MATFKVPIYDAPQVGLTAAPKGMPNAQPAPGTFGEGIARGLGAVGDAFQQEVERVNKIRVDSARNALLPKLSAVRDELASQQGEAALLPDANGKDATARALDKLTAAHDEVAKDLTAGQKALFAREVETYKSQLASFGSTHRTNETNKLEIGNLEGGITEGINTGVAAARLGDLAGLVTSQAITLKSAQDLARKRGFNPDDKAGQAFVTAQMSKFHAGVLDAYKSKNMTTEFNAYYEANKKQMDATSLNQYGREADIATDSAKGDNFYSENAKLGAKDFTDKVHASGLSEGAKKQALYRWREGAEAAEFDDRKFAKDAAGKLHVDLGNPDIGWRAFNSFHFKSMLKDPRTSKYAQDTKDNWEREARIDSNSATPGDLFEANIKLAAEKFKPDVMSIDHEEATARARTLGPRAGTAFMEWWTHAKLAGVGGTIDRDTITSAMKSLKLVKDTKSLTNDEMNRYSIIETRVREALGNRGSAVKPTPDEIYKETLRQGRTVVVEENTFSKNKVLMRAEIDTPEEVSKVLLKIPVKFASDIANLQSRGKLPDMTPEESVDFWFTAQDLDDSKRNSTRGPILDPVSGGPTAYGVEVLVELYGKPRR